MPILSRLRPFGQKSSPLAEGYSLPQPLHMSTQPPSEVTDITAPDSDEAILSHHHVLMVKDIRSSLSPTCPWLELGDLQLTGAQPIAAGGSADIWEATLGGRKVILKSHRCYVVFNDSQVFAGFHNEVQVQCTLFHHRDTNTVPFLGVYSTEAHPFGLVYEHMGGLDLRQYLMNEPGAQKLKLLTEIAQSLKGLHSLDIVLGGLNTTNVLLDNDGVPHIAGLSSARTLCDSTGLTSNASTSSSRLLPNAVDATLPTKPGDVYAFGVMAFEVLTGSPPFSELTTFAANSSMNRGDRPTRPNNPQITDGLWLMIEQAWHKDPPKRLSIEGVVSILEKELRCESCL